MLRNMSIVFTDANFTARISSKSLQPWLHEVLSSSHRYPRKTAWRAPSLLFVQSHLASSTRIKMKSSHQLKDRPSVGFAKHTIPATLTKPSLYHVGGQLTVRPPVRGSHSRTLCPHHPSLLRGMYHDEENFRNQHRYNSFKRKDPYL